MTMRQCKHPSDLHANELAVLRLWLQRQADQCIDRGLLGNDLERPALLVLELNEPRFVFDYFVTLVGAVLEEFRKCEPLSLRTKGVRSAVVSDRVRRFALKVMLTAIL